MILPHMEALSNACKTNQGRFLGLGTGYQLDSLTETHFSVCMRTVYTYSNGIPKKYDTYNSSNCVDFYKNWDSSDYFYDPPTNSYKYVRVSYGRSGRWVFFLSNNFMIDSLIHDIDGKVDRIDRNLYNSNFHINRTYFNRFSQYDSIVFNDSGRILFRGDSSGVQDSIICHDKGNRCECSNGVIEFVKNGNIDSIFSGAGTNSYKYYWSSHSTLVNGLKNINKMIQHYNVEHGFRVDGRIVIIPPH